VDRVYGVMVRIGGTHLRPGEIIARRDPPGALALGCFPRGVDELCESVAEALRSVDFAVLVVPDVMRYKWGKLMGNLGNAVPAITNSQDETTRRIADAARAEASELLLQAGVEWMPQDQLRREWPGLERPIRGRAEAEGYSSTWQSLARQSGAAEAEYLNGEIARLGERLGADAPINRTLAEIVMDMAARREPPGRHTPSELCQLLGLSCDDGGPSEPAIG
jgi:2-dehydropantoate 2-reductase